ncbi:MAG: family 20 glycosylhydrolase [Candidatus Omnitrophica bacterium]|nr:family 20 glycosylhydrolase [Candidatus Omnitrophota bacterium]
MAKVKLILLFLIIPFLHLKLALAGELIFKNNIKITPAPKEIVYGKGCVRIEAKDWSICLDMDDSSLLFIGRQLCAHIKKSADIELALENYPAVLKPKNIVLKVIKEKTEINQFSDFLKGDIFEEIGMQGYILAVKDSNVYLIARSAEGIFYAVQTLKQLIRKDEKTIFFPEIHIKDYPRIAVRGVHFLGIEKECIYQQLQYMAEHKLNMAIFDVWDMFDLDHYESSRDLKKIFDYARQNYIEPVPQISSLSCVAPFLLKNPNCAEGIWQENIPWQFKNEILAPVTEGKSFFNNILITDDSPLIIKSTDGKIRFEEGKDYIIERHEIKYPYNTEDSSLIIRRLASGRIKSGEIILMNYNCVELKNNQVPYCPSEKETYEIMFSAIENVITHLKPEFIHFGHDEIKGMNKDSRCLKRGLSNAQLFADDINCLYNFAKKHDKGIKIMLWDDMLNPWDNGGNENYQIQYRGKAGKTADAIAMIPKDIILMSWWYEENDRLGKMGHIADFHRSKDLKYFCCPWDKKKNILDWIEIAASDKGCLGVIITNWYGWKKNVDNISFMAEKAW